jgi:divalent metal cation (Fe/Co/Zn/Cd) transporter
LAKSERLDIHVSNIVNLILFITKVAASFESVSMAVIASTLDSLLDLLSGFILWFTAHAMKKLNMYSYPIGKRRMQPVVRTMLDKAWHFVLAESSLRI